MLGVCTIAVLSTAPAEAWREPRTPETRALYGYLLTLVALAVFRRTGRRRLEQVWLAVFLAAMPLIYVEAALLREGGLWVELGGAVLFGGFALLGILRSPWFLVAGIVGHGLGWDLWHLHRASTVPDWYAIDCALIDVGVGAYLAARIGRGAAAAGPGGQR
jgi:hypothetical protein